MSLSPLSQSLANLLLAIENCRDRGNQEWLLKHRETMGTLVRNFMPSGSGIDNGTTLLEDESTSEKLVFQADFHHMDQHGGYDGWSEHKVIVTSSLAFGLNLRITGKNRDDIKDYLHEVYSHALKTMVDRDGKRAT